MAEVGCQVGLGGLVQSVQEASDFHGTMTESGTEPIGVRGLGLGGQLVLVAKGVQVANGQL